MNLQQHLFIIGSPRSGTTWLQILLGSHPFVATTVELRLFSNYIFPILNAWNIEKENMEKGRWDQGLPFIMSEKEFFDILDGLINATYSKVLDKKPVATHLLDKHPGYSRHVQMIQKFIPDAKFIHIIRDGRDVVCSMMAAHKNIGFGEAGIEGAAREWKEFIIESRKIADQKNHYLEIRYEDLLGNTAEILQQVYYFCNLKISDEALLEIVSRSTFTKLKETGVTGDVKSKINKMHYRKGKSGTWKEELDTLQQLKFNTIAGDLLIRLGYENNGDWIEGSKLNKTLIKFCSDIKEKFQKIKSYAPRIARFITHW